MMNFDFSSFFGGSKGGMGGFNFGDYSLIRSGNYKKMMKSYYSQVEEPSKQKSKTEKADKAEKKKKLDSIDNTGLSKMKSEADGLKVATEAFSKDDLWQQKEGEYDKDKIASAVKKFANEYNDVLNQSSKVSSKDVAQQTGFIKSMYSSDGTMSSSINNMFNKWI